MIPKVISKKRRSLSGHNRTEEHVVKCACEADLLRHLSGYRVDQEEGVVPPDLVLSHFDPARPNWALELLNAAGVTDNITIHTLH